jgi:hypothetical protein
MLTFPQGITNEEKQLMDERGRYFQEHFEAGGVLLYGVMATGGALGPPCWKAIARSTPAFGEGDPSVTARLNRFEICPNGGVGRTRKRTMNRASYFALVGER